MKYVVYALSMNERDLCFKASCFLSVKSKENLEPILSDVMNNVNVKFCKD